MMFLVNLPTPWLFELRASGKVLELGRAVQLRQAAHTPTDDDQFLAHNHFSKL